MKSAIKWMANNHVTANLIMMIFIAGGIVKGFNIKQEIFPEINLDKVRVSVLYPGAGPEEIEEGILLKIEDNLTGIDGIKEITSVATEGMGNVIAEIRSGENVDLILQDIKSEVDRIITFPEEAEEPVITKILNIRGVISVVVYGDVPERTLREQAEHIREELLTFPQITQAELAGVRPYEISVEISEENLRRYNLTLGDVAARLRQASLDLPGGKIKTQGGEILLRTKEKRYNAGEYEKVIVVADPDGTQVRLKDIGIVKDTFAETDLSTRFDGKPAALVKIFRVADQKPTEISKAVKKYLEQKKGSLPKTLHVDFLDDSSELLESRMDLLIKNACLGLLMVICVLGLFLEIRLALWVMLGVPISFFGTLLFLPFLDVSVNMISLFAFILALGILVDDAIIVGENIFQHRQKGKPFLQAAIEGAQEVSIPVIFSILTTVTAFLPLAFISGTMGKFMRAIPIVVITLLLVSLVESLFILPAHLSQGKAHRPNGNFKLLIWIDSIRLGFGRFLENFVAGPYVSFLRLCIRNRYTTTATAIAVLLLSVGVVQSGILKFTFMPVIDGDVIHVALKMPPGTPVVQTQKIEQMIIQKAMEVVDEIDRHRPGRKSILKNIYSVSGGSLSGGGPRGEDATGAGSNLLGISLFLTKSEKRNFPISDVTRLWRRKVGEIPGADTLTFSSNLIQMGANIDIEIAHSDFSVLEKVSDQIKANLTGYPGVDDITDSYNQGKPELKLKLTPEARTLGITEANLARQVRGAYYGAEALRLQIARNEVKVMVRYPEEDRSNLWNFDAMRIRTPQGGEIPLSRAAMILEGKGFSEIKRTNRKRVVNVTASVDSKQGNAVEILADLKQGLLTELKGDFPGLVFDLVGEEKERRESMESIKDGFLLALLAMFALMAIPFKSYSQPLLIMTAIPFGFVGAVAGHMIMGYQLSLMSFFGFVALSGVLVNDSLLLIDKINTNRRNGMQVGEALISAGTRRFRPILLTSLTTFFGLTPMIFETSVQAQFLIPMAISLGFGILFATGITLLLIPSTYMILEDVHRMRKTRKPAVSA